MERPYVNIHMLSSIDCKVTGKWTMERVPGEDPNFHPYFEYHTELVNQGYNVLCLGRVSLEESFANGDKPDLSKYKGKEIEYKDNMVKMKKNEKYILCFDRKGSLFWKGNTLGGTMDDYKDYKIVEILTEKVSKEYLLYCKEKDILYVFGGKEDIDLNYVLQKLKKEYDCDKINIEGGPILNSAFLKAGCLDEITLTVCPRIAETKDRGLFNEAKINTFILEKCYRIKENSNYMRMIYKIRK